MTARQQLGRLLPLALLILLAIIGLRGGGPAPGWNGPLAADVIGIGIALEVILAVLLVITVVRDLAARRAGESASAAELDWAREHVNVPARLRFANKCLLGAAMIAVAVVLLLRWNPHGTLSPGSRPEPAMSPPRGIPSLRAVPQPAAPSHFPFSSVLYGLLAALLVAAIAYLIWRSRRLNRAFGPPLAADVPLDETGLRDAVESGRAAFTELDDTRAAIIACYVAMEGSLAERGTARAVADTPDELLSRATQTGLVRGPAARTLTGLFYAARFSSRPLVPEQRETARRALDELAAELAERRPPETSPQGAGDDAPASGQETAS